MPTKYKKFNAACYMYEIATDASIRNYGRVNLLINRLSSWPEAVHQYFSENVMHKKNHCEKPVMIYAPSRCNPRNCLYPYLLLGLPIFRGVSAQVSFEFCESWTWFNQS